MVKKLHRLAILCVALAMAAVAQQRPEAPKTWALVVGISKYQKLPGGQQLQFADRDALLFSEAIQKRGVSAQNVKVLTGVDATAAAIKSAVGNWLARSVSESDTVLIFFSGHGLFEREFGESYLLGYDSDPKDPYATALSVRDLGQALSRRVRSGRILVIADAVRRDFFDPESDPDSSKSFALAFDQLTAARSGVSAIIASGPGEFSREGQRWGGHGVFAKHLADVLFDGASRTADLAVATEDLFELLKGRVGEDTSGKQRPWRSGKAFAQGEVARADRQNAPAPTPNFTPAPTLPNAGGLSKPPDANRRPDPLTPTEQNKDVAIKAPAIQSQPAAETRPVTEPAPTQRPSERRTLTEPSPVAPPVNATKKEPPLVVSDDRKPDPGSIVTREKVDLGAASASGRKADATAQGDARRGRNDTGRTRPAGPAKVAATREPSKPLPTRETTPPATGTAQTASPTAPRGELARANTPAGEVTPRPKPTVNPPSAVAVSPDRAGAQPETLATSVPTARLEAAPSPLVLQLEAAIASGTLIEPRTDSAWDLYQRMLSDSSTASDAARLKPALAVALTARGRAIVAGDVRADNISDRVDDFKQAGQMLARARSLTPDNGDISALEKLSAAAALISLQFYDEAERALAPLQATKLAAVENAMGLVYQGKLDTWRAERAFKRACEIDSKWAAPHYNLALLYRSQQNPAALAEFEAAAANDESNVNLLVALGDEYFARQQWKQAGDAFRKAVALNPSDDNLHTKLGHALYSQGLQDEANREYQKAQELRRKQPK